ncbi:MAG: PrsW family intramembrane metalloprotease, partial [Bacteroidota bacterium]|nr:PrsW family intramembrane metalloprotease [Bacteroidota bacterium]
AGIVFVALLIVPYLFVHYSGLGARLVLGERSVILFCIFISFIISYTWYRYLTWLDRFEREKIGWEIVVFILGSCCTFLVWPITGWIVPILNLQLDGSIWNDLWYTLIAIGLVEEIVKLVPLLLIIYFTKQADEPFDLILYGSISALGFAFVENTLYLWRTELFAIGGRVLYASVAHMFFTSIIAYSIAIAQRNGNSKWLYGLIGLLLAATAHGYYDYWLMSPTRPSLLTLIFFLGSIHLWIAMKNNLINISPHYQELMRPQSVMFRYRMINALLAIFLFTYVIKFLLQGTAPADDLMIAQGGSMGAVLLFLAISFSSFRFIPGYVAPLRPKGKLWKLLLPAVEWGEDLTGRELLLRIPEKRSDIEHYMVLHRMLPLKGRLSQRVIVKDEPDWYLFIPEQKIPFTGISGEVLLVRPFRVNDTLPDDRYILIITMAFKDRPAYSTAVIQKEQLQFTGYVHARLI